MRCTRQIAYNSPMTDQKSGASAALRAIATNIVNAQLIKLDEHTRRTWSPEKERVVTSDAAILAAWSARETAAHLSETAETLVKALDGLTRRANNEPSNLVERVDALADVAGQAARRLGQLTAIIAVATICLVGIGAFEAWLAWTFRVR
jgi:hypothetical protein